MKNVCVKAQTFFVFIHKYLIYIYIENMVTPLIDKLKTQGGTLYTFSSASKDLTRTFTNSIYDFSFSHFACLNLPNIRNGVYGSAPNMMNNGLYIASLLKRSYFDDNHSSTMFSSDGMNIALAENLQNYVFNFEVAILNGEGDNDDYDNDVLITPAERIFFNWLQKVGAIKFPDYNRSNPTLYNIEEVDTTTVQYIGTIDAINSVDVLGDSFSEVYLHIPGNAGATKDKNGGKVKFRIPNNDGKNYIPFKEYTVPEDTDPITGLPIEHTYNRDSRIIGREDAEANPFGLDMTPVYDFVTNTNGNIRKGYTTDAGYCIDFRPRVYGEEDTLTNINNASGDSFEFNCILIYYTLTNKETGESAINLYGVLFLEEITDIKVDDLQDQIDTLSYEQGYIRRYPKIKDDGSGNGNSFALKVDLKVDTLPDTTIKSRGFVDPNSAVSMSMYMDTLAAMQNCISVFNQQQDEILRLQNRVNYLENQLSLLNEIPNLESKITSLSESIVHSEQVVGLINWDDIDEGNLEEVVNRLKYSIDFGGVVIDGVNIKDLLLDNSRNIQSVINGKLTKKMQYNTDVLDEGYGVSIKKNEDNNSVSIASRFPTYNIIPAYRDEECTKEITKDDRMNLNLSGRHERNDVFITLDECYNLALLYIEDGADCNHDICIYIDDSVVGWKKGQSLIISIVGLLTTEGNITNDGSYEAARIRIFNNKKEITSQTRMEFVEDHIGARYIEIICVDDFATETADKFIYDIK